MLLRALDAELNRGADPALRAGRDEIDSHFIRWLSAAESALQPAPIPLARAVGFQLGMVLSATDLLSS